MTRAVREEIPRPIVHVDRQRHVAMEIDRNPRYRLMLCVTGAGVDLERVTDERYRSEGWTELNDARGALKFVNTFSRSFLPKTERAAQYLERIKMSEMKSMTMADLVAEYNRLTGRSVTRFSSRAAALKAIEKETTSKQPARANGEDAAAKAKAKADAKRENADMEAERAANGGELPSERAMRLASEQLKRESTTSKETEMPAAKKTTKGKGKAAKTTTAPTKKATKTPAKKTAAATKTPAKAKTKVKASRDDRAKKVAAMTKGSGGLIVKLLKEGKDPEAIVSSVLKHFPDRAVNLTQVSWYRSMLIHAGALKK